MTLLDKRSQLFRLLFGLFAAYFLAVAGTNFYRYASSPTDENLFTDPKSDLYFIQSIPATLVKSSSEQPLQVVPESINVGDLLTMVDGVITRSRSELNSAIETAGDDSLLTVNVQRLAENRSYRYKVRKSSLSRSTLRDLTPAALVIAVTENGASDRAGMEVGDLIMRINGQSFNNANHADKILRQAQTGKAIEYDILRDNQHLTLHVTLAAFGMPIFFLSLVLAGLVYMGVGVFIGLQRPQHIAARLVGLFFLLLGFALAVGPIQRDVQEDLVTHVRTFSFVFALFLAFAVSLHSHHYFPKERPELVSKRYIRWTGYLLAVIAGASVMVVGNIAFLIGIAVSLLYTIVAPLIYRKQTPQEYKRMSRVIRWSGIAVGVSAGFISFIISESGGIRIDLLTYLGIILLIIPASYLYTIMRYRLLEMNLRVKRNVQYSFVAIAWGVISFVVLLWLLSLLLRTDLGLPNVRLTGASIEVIEGPMPLHERAIWEKSVAVGLAIGLTFIFRWAGRSGQEVIAKKFYRAQYDYRRAGSELAEVMATRLNMADLARDIVEKLANLMRLKRVGVMFFRNQESTCCQEVQGFDGGQWNSFCMNIESNLIQSLKGFSGEVNVDYLPIELKQEFRQNEFQFVIPIRSKEKLVGALLVGEKLSESAFHNEDLEFLAAVAKQASVAIENAFLYEELAGQERMKHELAIARRIQLESLPQTTPKVKGLDIAGISIPAMEVGGDYFDYLNGDPGKLTVIVGDVSGKGTSAALYMSKVQGILRSLHAFGLSPRDLFIRANHLLCGDIEKKSFITAMGGTFDTEQRTLTLSRAGHLPLYYFNASTGKVERIIPRGLGLGLSQEALFASELEERVIQYNSSDVFVFLTDGITEGKQKDGDEFGDDRLVYLLQSDSKSSAEQIRDSIVAAVKQFAGDASQHDDQTVVVVRAA